MSTREVEVCHWATKGLADSYKSGGNLERSGSDAIMLKISQSDYEKLRSEAERSYPHECCGILLGSVSNGVRIVTHTVSCENMSNDAPGRRYSIDPHEIISAMKLARTRGENVVGFYHSHPDHPAQPSATDLAEAHWLDCSYVITSAEQGRAIDTKAFALRGHENNKRFELEEVEILSQL
jgi:proteasome lid subunit RPN8/RPN11